MTPSFLVSALPAQEPITYDEVRDSLRIDGDDEFDFIEEAITSSREYCEKYLNRAIVDQEVTATFPAFPSDSVLWLPYGSGLLDVTSVSYVDEYGDQQTLDSGVYSIDKGVNPGGIFLQFGGSWPATVCDRQAVRVVYRVGFCLLDEVATTKKIPRSIKSAIILLVGDLFNNRAAQHDFSLQENPTIKNLLRPYRIRGF